MIEVEMLVARELDRLLPPPGGAGADWEDVVRRSRFRYVPVTARQRKRVLLALALVVVAALIPLSALAIANDNPWWFLRLSPPWLQPEKPAGSIMLVAQGRWSGTPWALTAYRSASDDLCLQVTFKGRSGHSAPNAASCGAVPGTRGFRSEITYLAASGGQSSNGVEQPAYIVGSVLASAQAVTITLANGTVIHTKTIGAPEGLHLPISFYAVRLPALQPAGSLGCAQRMQQQAQLRPRELIGLDRAGRVVARLRVPRGHLLDICGRHENHFSVPPDVPAPGRTLRTVARTVAPYGATATLAIGGRARLPEVPARLGRCWRVRFSNGESQGTCTPDAARTNAPWFLDYREVQHAGRDTFVIAQAAPGLRPPVTRIALRIDGTPELATRTIDGIAVFAIPRTALSTTHSRRGYLIGYTHNGKRVGSEVIYFRSCPLGSPCY